MTPSRVEQAEREVRFDRLILTRFAAAVRSFASSDEGWKAKFLFGLLIAFLFAINGLNVVNSYVARDFMTAIASRDRARFISQATLYIGVFAASTITAVLYRFSEERLALRWRWWVTRELLTHYLARRAYYYLEATDQIANPDERIAEDARAFTTTTLSFVLLFLNGTFTVLAFAGVLWSISTLLFGVAVAYAALGSVLTIVLGRPLIWLNYNQLDQEANLRADLIHLRQNAELVALSHHEARLGARLLQRLDSLTANWRRVTAVNRNLAFFTTGYNYMIQIIPALVIAPLFLRGEVEFGVITQSAISFSYLLGAFSLIVTQFQSISSFAAVVARLNSLTQATDRAEAGASPIETCEANDRVAWENLTLLSPTDGRTLVGGLSASLARGTRLLIRTTSEAAGAALFRATAGLWHTGSGRIIRPGLDDILFLPERPYMPLGTLRAALLRTGQEHTVTDAQILSTLQQLGTADLVSRAGGLDREQDWDNLLSLGERQLLAVARLLLANPPFAFLDRVDTALGSEQTALVFKVLSLSAITYIVFEGEGDGMQSCDAVLDLGDGGTWQWMSVRKTDSPNRM